MTTVKIFVLHALCYSTTVVAYKYSKRENQLYVLYDGNLAIAMGFMLISSLLSCFIFGVTNTWGVFYHPTAWLCVTSAGIASVFGSTVGILMRNEIERNNDLQMYQAKLKFYEVDSEDYEELQFLIKRLRQESKVYNPKDNDFIRVCRYLLSFLQRKRTP